MAKKGKKGGGQNKKGGSAENTRPAPEQTNQKSG